MSTFTLIYILAADTEWYSFMCTCVCLTVLNKYGYSYVCQWELKNNWNNCTRVFACMIMAMYNITEQKIDKISFNFFYQKTSFDVFKHFMCCAHTTRLMRVCLCYHVPYEEQRLMQNREKSIEIEVRHQFGMFWAYLFIVHTYPNHTFVFFNLRINIVYCFKQFSFFYTRDF